MSDYFFDEDHGIAYKIDPIAASVVHSGGNETLRKILVHTDVKVTNVKKEKIRRTLSGVYPYDHYDPETAKRSFADTLLSRFIIGARKISEQEYEHIKTRFEA